MKVKKLITLVIQLVVAVVLIVGIAVTNVILKPLEEQITSFLSQPIVDEEALAASSASGQELSARIVEEGAILFKNANDTLPLDYQKEKKVNVFGWRSVDWILGSVGPNASGGVASETGNYNTNVGFLKALKNYGIQYNTRLQNMYENYKEPDNALPGPGNPHISNFVPLVEPDFDNKEYYSDDLLDYSEKYSEVAFVVIGRMAGEGMNANASTQLKRGPGNVDDNTRHYLEISTEEEKLLRYVGANYDKVIVLLSVSNQFECGFLNTIEGIDACLYVGFTGTRGVNGLPKVLWGEVSPSGHTVDTFAYDLWTNPANKFSGGSYLDYGRSYTDYIEGIYVGYKWYETADVEGFWEGYTSPYAPGKTGYDAVVQFPFGYGGSYNTYSWEVTDMSVAPGASITNQTKITVKLNVTNNGLVPGRDSIQAYVTQPYTPGEIEKASIALCSIAKTEIIQPGATVPVEITVDAYDFMSYDCYDMNENGHKGYELEEGNYVLKLMTDAHNVKQVTYGGSAQSAEFTYVVDQTINVDTDPITGQTVKNLFTGADAVDATPLDGGEKDGTYPVQINWFKRQNSQGECTFPAQADWTNARRNATPSAKRDPKASVHGVSTEWANATGNDEFGNPIPTTAPTWGANNGKKVYANNQITELGKQLGKDYNDPAWDSLLDQVTTAEVVELFNAYYGSDPMASVGKPKLADFDGPAQIKGFTSAPRGTGYPTMVLLASTWNPNLAYEFGQSYGKDMVSVGVYGIWGWAMDTHRTSWFGRNHESPSEDGVLAGIIVANAVKGLHTQGRYSFIKHFALYGTGNQHRYLSEQTFREVYLRGFRMAFVEGGALGCMTTYQGIGSENSETTRALLTGVLRNEWQFKGAITTDAHGTNEYADGLFYSGGNFGMGNRLGTTGLVYDTSATPRVQHRLRDSAHQVLYMWLHADYLADQYNEYVKLLEDFDKGTVNKETYIAQNPEKWAEYQERYPVSATGSEVMSSTSIYTWEWYAPTLNIISVSGYIACAMWIVLALIGFFYKDEKAEQTSEGGKE